MTNLLKFWFGLLMLSVVMISFHARELMTSSDIDSIPNISIEDRIAFQKNKIANENYPCLLNQDSKEDSQSCEHSPCKQVRFSNIDSSKPTSFIHP